MKPTFNPNCGDCPRAVECNEAAAIAIGEVAGQRTRIRLTEEALRHDQAAYQIMQHLEATGLPGEVDQERAIVRDVGVDLPEARDLFATRQDIKDMQATAEQLQKTAEDATQANDDLMRECPGPRAVRFANFYIATCQGNGLSFLKRVFFSKTQPGWLNEYKKNNL